MISKGIHCVIVWNSKRLAVTQVEGSWDRAERMDLWGRGRKSNFLLFAFIYICILGGFPGGLGSEESACNTGDLCLIPGSERSPGEGNGYPLQYSWASLEAQLVKNPPAMRETWLLSLGWEDPLEKGKAIHSSNLTWRIP